MQENEFNALAAQGYNRIPVTLETFADLDTALSIYLNTTNIIFVSCAIEITSACLCCSDNVILRCVNIVNNFIS